MTSILNIVNRTLFTGDNLNIMRGMNTGCVDLIYLDPPFNSNQTYAAPIGSKAAGAAFKDTWTLDDVDLAWHGQIAEEHPGLYAIINAAGICHGKPMKAYLIMMGVRLLEMRRLLKDSGSIYLHCDPTASHYLKMAMDSVFGKENFRNEIVWCYTGPSGVKYQFPRKHDTVLFYSRSDKWTFNSDAIRIPYNRLNVQNPGGGIGGNMDKNKIKTYSKKGKLPESWWPDFSPVGRLKKEHLGYPTQKPPNICNANGSALIYPKKRPIWSRKDYQTQQACLARSHIVMTFRCAPM